MPKIFEPFFTTKEAGKGTGLGLAMVFGVVRQHHGWIQVESELGRGTTFKIFLPALEPASACIAIEPNAPGTVQGSETILLVEDEAEVRAATRMILEQQGYTVLEAGTGVEALAQWQQHPGKVSLVLSDMILPDGMSGRELASRLQGERPALKVVFTTGYGPEMGGGEIELCEGRNFLQKPWTTAKLCDVLRQCLAA